MDACCRANSQATLFSVLLVGLRGLVDHHDLVGQRGSWVCARLDDAFADTGQRLYQRG